jgi:two-component system, NtrC family, sensor kinase
MIRASLKFKVGFYIVIALTVAVFLFTLMVVKHNRDELLRQAVSHTGQLADVVIKSTRLAMLQNKPSHVSKIIQDVGAQQDIEKVRILSKNGTIIHSSQTKEIGSQVDQEAESCLACHLDEKSLQESPLIGRPRFFTDQDGRRMLGSTAVIRNEPSCSNGGCHVHAEDQSVLGVLDIIYPLNKIDQTMRSNTFTIVGLSLGFVILAAFLVSFLVNRMVYLPLRDLEEGAHRLATGDLEKPIPVRSTDEFGQLAASFNSMTRALRKSHVELQDWGRTLEKKVEEAMRELHIAQAETVRSEKLASVGLLTAGIAHELNNPLTGVLTFSHLVRKQMPEGSPEAEDLDLVIHETKRCATIIRRLLKFAREKTPEKNFSDLNKLIEDTARLIEQPAQVDDIEIILELDEHLPAVWIDEDLISQVIMNILVNAQHAIEGEGSITIRTRVDDVYKKSEPGGEAVPMVEISVIDTGCGIAEADLQRIFDPFFTTKGVGKGTGLGLSISHGTVAAHGGEIEVESKLGAGTVFRIYLPIGGSDAGNNGSEQ